jgi:hypothetical protein
MLRPPIRFGRYENGRQYITVLRQPDAPDASKAGLSDATSNKGQYLTDARRQDATDRLGVGPVQLGAAGFCRRFRMTRTESPRIRSVGISWPALIMNLVRRDRP